MTISPFQFSQPILTKAVFEMRHLNSEAQDVPELHLHRNTINIEGNNKAIVELIVQINKKDDVELDGACFVCEVAMQSMFIWNNDFSDEEIKTLLELNAPATLLAYIRPIVASLTNASPLPVYNIPFINMTGNEDN